MSLPRKAGLPVHLFAFCGTACRRGAGVVTSERNCSQISIQNHVNQLQLLPPSHSGRFPVAVRTLGRDISIHLEQEERKASWERGSSSGCGRPDRLCNPLWPTAAGRNTGPTLQRSWSRDKTESLQTGRGSPCPVNKGRKYNKHHII